MFLIFSPDFILEHDTFWMEAGGGVDERNELPVRDELCRGS